MERNSLKRLILTAFLLVPLLIMVSENVNAGWSPMYSGTSNDLMGVWGISGSDVFAVGDDGTILHYDGVSEICFSRLIYGDHSEEAELLRCFRDNVLSQTPVGREIIRPYYKWSLAIVKAMEEDEEFREQVKEMIDGVLGLLGGKMN